jgi:hypothetical protein
VTESDNKQTEKTRFVQTHLHSVGYLDEMKNRGEGVYTGHPDVTQNDINGLLQSIIPVTDASRKGSVRISKSCHKLVKITEVINFVICICLLHDFKCIIIFLVNSNVTHNSFLCIYFYFNSLHVSSTSCSSSGETNCVNTISGNCHSVSVAVSFARRK